MILVAIKSRAWLISRLVSDVLVHPNVRPTVRLELPTRARVLVAERDPHVGETLRVNLVAAGHAVTVVTDGLAALRAFDTEPPALVTLELLLPSISGFRLATLFKRARPEVPVLVLTSLAFEEAEEVVHAGVEDFLTKPIDPHILVQKVRYHLRPLRYDAESAKKVQRREPIQRSDVATWPGEAKRKRKDGLPSWATHRVSA